ncbi:MAG TPA: isochorismatase family protein [Acidimicrobiia bacterium]|nr:isochorismatase family protein [Acidimicrobiia bacterium]
MPVPRFDPHTALVVVDCQNDFADPSGSLYVTGADRAIVAINQAIAAALSAGAPVFYTQDWHPPSTPHFEKDGGIWPVHCVAGTTGAELHPDLVVEGPVVRKGANGEDGYSGFTMRDPVSGDETPTELDNLLRAAGVARVVVGGLALDYCVKATAIDAARLGYDTMVPLELTAPVELRPGDGAAAAAAMRESGARVD